MTKIGEAARRGDLGVGVVGGVGWCGVSSGPAGTLAAAVIASAGGHRRGARGAEQADVAIVLHGHALGPLQGPMAQGRRRLLVRVRSVLGCRIPNQHGGDRLGEPLELLVAPRMQSHAVHAWRCQRLPDFVPGCSNIVRNVSCSSYGMMVWGDVRVGGAWPGGIDLRKVRHAH
jgi:hypothetical protein